MSSLTVVNCEAKHACVSSGLHDQLKIKQYTKSTFSFSFSHLKQHYLLPFLRTIQPVQDFGTCLCD